MAILRSYVLPAVMFIIVGVAAGFAQSSSRSYYYMDSDKKQGYLGVEVQDVTQRLKERKELSTDRGAYITNVIEDSPAEKAGIKEGDVIVKIADRTIDDGDDLTRVVRKNKPDAEVKIELLRKAEHKTLTATLARVPTPRAYAYSFGNGSRPFVPKMPRMPQMPKMPQAFGHLNVMRDHDMYGLEVQDLTKQLGEFLEVPDGRGILVSAVKKGSDAEKAGFKAGDVITKIDHHSVRDIDDLSEELYDQNDSEKGRDVSFDVVRKGKSTSLSMHVVNEDEDRDNSDNDEDDDSESFNVPYQHHGGQSFQFRTSPSRHFDIEELHERLLELRDQLREQFQNIRQSLREIFAHVQDNGSAVTTSIIYSTFTSLFNQPSVPFLYYRECVFPAKTHCPLG